MDYESQRNNSVGRIGPGSANGSSIPASALSVPTSIVDVVDITPDEFAKLRKLNLAMGLLFLVISILLLAGSIVEDSTGLVPVYGVWWIRDSDAGVFNLELQSIDREVRVYFLAFVFTLLAAIDHLLVCTVLRPAYELRLRRGQNPFRWCEYSVSASVMNVLIALECGILDVLLLVAVGSATMTCMFFGWLGELVREQEVQNIIFWLGCVPFAAAWGIIFAAFSEGAVRADGSIPGFVWAIVFALFVIECAFGVNQIVPRKSYFRREITYIILSPTAKLLLAGLTYGGIRSLPTPPDA